MPLIPLNVMVRYGESRQPDELRESMTRELAVLLDDLALPAEPVLELSQADNLHAQQLEIAIAGHVCPNRVSDRTRGAGPLTYRLQELLHANVESLLTPDVVQSMWHIWNGNGEIPPEGFARLLRTLVHYRLRPDRIAGFVPRWHEVDPTAMLEAAMSATSRRIEIELHPDSRAELEPELTGPEELFRMMRDGLFYELGIRIGDCVLTDDASADHNAMRVRVNDVRTAPHSLLESDECLVNDTVERLRLLNIPARIAFNPANGNECAVVPREFKNACEAAGLTTWTPAGYAVLATSTVMRRVAPALVTVDLVEFDLNNLAQAFPVLTEGIRKRIGTARFAQVLRTLLEEEISVRNLPFIMDAILHSPPRTSIDMDRYIVFGSTYGAVRLGLSLDDLPMDGDAIEIAECVRMNLKRYISHKYTRGQSTLIVYLIDAPIEERLREVRPLDESEHRELLDAVAAEVDGLPPTAQSPVLLTTASVRYRLRQSLSGTFPGLAVLCYQELSPEMNIQPIARIAL